MPSECTNGVIWSSREWGVRVESIPSVHLWGMRNAHGTGARSCVYTLLYLLSDLSTPTTPPPLRSPTSTTSGRSPISSTAELYPQAIVSNAVFPQGSAPALPGVAAAMSPLQSDVIKPTTVSPTSGPLSPPMQRHTGVGVRMLTSMVTAEPAPSGTPPGVGTAASAVGASTLPPRVTKCTSGPLPPACGTAVVAPACLPPLSHGYSPRSASQAVLFGARGATEVERQQPRFTTGTAGTTSAPLQCPLTSPLASAALPLDATPSTDILARFPLPAPVMSPSPPAHSEAANAPASPISLPAATCMQACKISPSRMQPSGMVSAGDIAHSKGMSPGPPAIPTTVATPTPGTSTPEATTSAAEPVAPVTLSRATHSPTQPPRSGHDPPSPGPPPAASSSPPSTAHPASDMAAQGDVTLTASMAFIPSQSHRPASSTTSTPALNPTRQSPPPGVASDQLSLAKPPHTSPSKASPSAPAAPFQAFLHGPPRRVALETTAAGALTLDAGSSPMLRGSDATVSSVTAISTSPALTASSVGLRLVSPSTTEYPRIGPSLLLPPMTAGSGEGAAARVGGGLGSVTNDHEIGSMGAAALPVHPAIGAPPLSPADRAGSSITPALLGPTSPPTGGLSSPRYRPPLDPATWTPRWLTRLPGTPLVASVPPPLPELISGGNRFAVPGPPSPPGETRGVLDGATASAWRGEPALGIFLGTSGGSSLWPPTSPLYPLANTGVPGTAAGVGQLSPRSPRSPLSPHSSCTVQLAGGAGSSGGSSGVSGSPGISAYPVCVPASPPLLLPSSSSPFTLPVPPPFAPPPQLQLSLSRLQASPLSPPSTAGLSPPQPPTLAALRPQPRPSGTARSLPAAAAPLLAMPPREPPDVPVGMLTTVAGGVAAAATEARAGGAGVQGSGGDGGEVRAASGGSLGRAAASEAVPRRISGGGVGSERPNANSAQVQAVVPSAVVSATERDDRLAQVWQSFCCNSSSGGGTRWRYCTGLRGSRII